MSLDEKLSFPEERFCSMTLYCLDLAAIHKTGVNVDCCISSTVTICTV
jgi:hypothetical protein